MPDNMIRIVRGKKKIIIIINKTTQWNITKLRGFCMSYI